MIPIALTCLTLLPQGDPLQQTQPPEMNDLERRFAQEMSGCKMVGRFTMRGSDKPAQRETYEIAKVTKVDGTKWRFHAKIQYAKKSAVTLPLLVDVRWAGDTPVIQVTDMRIPMMGTYTARVVVYRGEYAGTWSGVGYGGQMFGEIVSPTADPAAPQDKQVNWSDWRGPDGRRSVDQGRPPTEWSEEKNLRFKIRVPGSGSSSPVVFGDRVYVTSAIETERPGAAADAAGGRDRGGFGGGRTPTNVYEFLVLAYDSSDGRQIWRTKVNEVVPHEGWHDTGSAAPNSPITDGQRVYAHFGSRGLHCLDLEGKVVWSKQFGKMRTRNSFGEGSSPALHGDTLVVVWDHEGDSFIVALDKRTGDERWRKPRSERTSWATPLIVEVDGKLQVIVSATGTSCGYDLDSGEVIWTCAGMTDNAIPSPVYVDGIVYLMSGYRGSSLQAIRLAGAKGDLGGTDHLLWQHRAETSYVPSHLVYRGVVYFLRVSSGVLSCLDAKTGKVHYEGQKLPRIGTTYSSPVGAGGHVYITSRRGYTKVLAAGPEYKEIATNRLKDQIDATPAIVGDAIYFRGQSYLYCIAAPRD